MSFDDLNPITTPDLGRALNRRFQGQQRNPLIGYSPILQPVIVADTLSGIFPDPTRYRAMVAWGRRTAVAGQMPFIQVENFATPGAGAGPATGFDTIVRVTHWKTLNGAGAGNIVVGIDKTARGTEDAGRVTSMDSRMPDDSVASVARSTVARVRSGNQAGAPGARRLFEYEANSLPQELITFPNGGIVLRPGYLLIVFAEIVAATLPDTLFFLTEEVAT